MSAAELLTDLTRLGIEVVAHKDRLRYRPQSALTPDLAERLRTHKAELLAILGPAVAPDGATTTPTAGEAERAERDALTAIERLKLPATEQKALGAGEEPA